jgi:hypothetical protein
LAWAALSQAGPRNDRLGRVHTWAFAIGDGNLVGDVGRRFAGYDLVVLDGEGAAKAQVTALRRAGKLVLAYLDVGTIEPGRSWYPLLKRYRLDYWADFGEWYADAANPRFRAILSRIASTTLHKGFDGLFLDNTDMIESHPRQTAGIRSLVRSLARLVHRRGGLLFSQNGESSIGPTLAYYDGWNREDVSSTYDFGARRYVGVGAHATRAADAALRRIAARGLLVLTTDYVAAGDVAGARAAVANACTTGALPFVSDIGLRRVPAIPPRCGA